MFVSVPDLSWIIAEKPEVLTVLRSPDVQALSGAPPELPPVQAYVVVAGSKGNERVFAALHVKSLKRNLVYRCDAAPGTAADSEALCRNAKQILARCHFALDAINLNLSAALRDVVIRDIPVVMDGKNAALADRKRQEELAEWRRLAAEAQQGEAEKAAESPAGKEHLQGQHVARQKLAAAEAAEAQLAQLRMSFEKIAQPEAAQKKPAPEKAPAVAPVAAPAAAPPAADLERARQDVVRLATEARKATQLEQKERAARERLAAEKEALEQQAAKLAAAARAAAAQAKADQTEMERLLARQAEAERQAKEAAARAEAAMRSQQLASAEREQLEKVVRETQRRAVEMTDAAHQAELRAKSERSEREALEGAKQAAEHQAEDLSRMVREIEANLAREREEKQRLAQEKAEAEKRLQELARITDQASSAERAERQRREAEKAEQERQERERLLAERTARLAEEKAALEQRAARLAEEAREAARQAELERQARERLEAEKKLAEQRLQTLDAGRPQLAPKRAAPPPVRRSAVPGAFFNVDWELTTVPGDPLREVIELQQSISMVQLSLEGFPGQYCAAFILGLKRGGGFTVNVVFHLTESQRLLVYVPSRPMPNQGAYRRGVQEACRFLQVVGMETEVLSLPDSVRSRAQLLAAVPIFSECAVAG